MPLSETQSVRELPGVAVLTLPETAEYLRVPTEAVLELVEQGTLPAQRIGGEWRFLKRAVVDWLRFGTHYHREFGLFPPAWMLNHPYWEELIQELREHVLSKVPSTESSTTQRGSKQAVLKHFGIFKDDADLEEQLAGLRANPPSN